MAATSASAEEQPQVLKNDQTFAMFDRFGDIQVLAPGKEGLYHNDTRYLSHQELLIDGARPLHLGSSVEDSNSLLAIDLMNPDLPAKGGRPALAKGTLHIFRAKLLWQRRVPRAHPLTHHGSEPTRVRLEFTFDADFVDLFEVRGMKRERRGDRLQPEVAAARGGAALPRPRQPAAAHAHPLRAGAERRSMRGGPPSSCSWTRARSTTSTAR